MLVLCTAACQRSPQEKAAKFLRDGKDLMSRKDYARAVLQFRNAVRLLPKDAEVEYQLGLAYLADGKLAEGVAAITKSNHSQP